MNNTKTCSKCGETKPLSEFYQQHTGRGGHLSRCKPCADEMHRRWLRDNHAYWNQYLAEYRRRKKEQTA